MKIQRDTLKIQRKAKGPAVEELPLEEECVQEVSAALQAFKDRNEAEAKLRVEATDSEFWVALCFETRAQKEEFLAKVGLLAWGDKYLDGRLMAKAMGIVLENKGSLGPLKVKRDRDYEALSLSERR